MDQKIVKVKIKGDFLLVSLMHAAGKSKTTHEDREPVHDDLKNAMKRLDKHFVIMMEFANAKSLDKIPDDVLKDYSVTGYTITAGGMDEDNAGIIITALKTLKSGKKSVMNTPLTRFEENEATQYRHIVELTKDIQVIETEAFAYLNEGKRAPKAQTELAFDEHETDDVDVSFPKKGTGAKPSVAPIESANSSPKNKNGFGKGKNKMSKGVEARADVVGLTPPLPAS